MYIWSSKLTNLTVNNMLSSLSHFLNCRSKIVVLIWFAAISWMKNSWMRWKDWADPITDLNFFSVFRNFKKIQGESEILLSENFRNFPLLLRNYKSWVNETFHQLFKDANSSVLRYLFHLIFHVSWTGETLRREKAWEKPTVCQTCFRRHKFD